MVLLGLNVGGRGRLVHPGVPRAGMRVLFPASHEEADDEEEEEGDEDAPQADQEQHHALGATHHRQEQSCKERQNKDQV